ncbi:hypothetical protein L2E82_40317 [Cichorium intybus]|uniref:Uncharacterized protein n=1 Tax=Cichorium intybus TaxID=13427 RepID=A0ACB9AJX4_CICIN|nr:hypothetical protein L2E82_40317 [Cichorium intybus]
MNFPVIGENLGHLLRYVYIAEIKRKWGKEEGDSGEKRWNLVRPISSIRPIGFQFNIYYQRNKPCSSGRSLVRKNFVFEPLSEDSRRNSCEKIQAYVDSLVFESCRGRC